MLCLREDLQAQRCTYITSEFRVCQSQWLYHYWGVNHSSIHSEEPKFKCIVCDKTFAREQSLQQHLEYGQKFDWSDVYWSGQRQEIRRRSTFLMRGVQPVFSYWKTLEDTWTVWWRDVHFFLHSENPGCRSHHSPTNYVCGFPGCNKTYERRDCLYRHQGYSLLLGILQQSFISLGLQNIGPSPPHVIPVIWQLDDVSHACSIQDNNTYYPRLNAAHSSKGSICKVSIRQTCAECVSAHMKLPGLLPKDVQILNSEI